MKFERNIEPMKMPENLRVGMMVQEHRLKRQKDHALHDYYNFVLGQSPFHTPYPMQKALADSANKNFYSPAKGINQLIQEIMRFNKAHFDLDLDEKRIVIGNGTKMIMFMLMSMIKGHYIVPSPAWIGYVPLLDYLGKSYEVTRLKEAEAYKLHPDTLDALMEEAKDTPVFILNNPHNPTGALYTESELEALAEVCKKHKALVIADEIYALTTYKQEDFVSMAKIYPEGTFVTNGISKDRSSAGYRLGTCILPSVDTEIIHEKYACLASTMYTNVATPIQYASITGYSDNQEIKDYMDTIRQIHTMVGTYFSAYCNTIPGVKASVPHGGFYFTLDFNALKDKLKTKGIDSAHKLTKALLDTPYYIALVMGESIAISNDDLIARIAFIDYDGEKVYHQFIKETPTTDEEKQAFIESNMSHMVEGFQIIKRFISDLDS